MEVRKVKIIKKYVKNCFSGLANLVFPPICPGCGQVCGSAGGLCADCFSKLVFIIEPFCHRCGKPIDAIAKEWGFCPFCKESGGFCFDEARVALIYDESSAALILGLKYADKTETTPMLARWLRRALGDLTADVVVPVPLSRSRLLQRRYNQAALLAKQLAAMISVKYKPLLKRNRDTGNQGNLSGPQRKKNVKGAFSVTNDFDIKGKTVIIVDDVMTTGATMNECAKTLKQAGAGKIIAVTLATVLK